MHFSLLTLILIAAAAWYGWRAWSAVQAGVIEARMLPVPGLRVQRIERQSRPADFNRAIGVFVLCAAVCSILAVAHMLGLLNRFGVDG